MRRKITYAEARKREWDNKRKYEKTYDEWCVEHGDTEQPLQHNNVVYL